MCCEHGHLVIQGGYTHPGTTTASVDARQDVQALIQRAEDEHPDQEIAGLLHIGGGNSWKLVGPQSIQSALSGFVGK